MKDLTARLIDLLGESPTDALVTNDHVKDLAEHLALGLKQDLGTAWNAGWETAARCYWYKPRNPFTQEMNDADPADYCLSHGGTGGTEDCCANPYPGRVSCPGKQD